MVDFGRFGLLQPLNGKGVGLGQHALGALVAVLAVFVFKEYAAAAGQGYHVNTFLTELADNRHLRGAYGRYQLKVGLR